MSESGALIPRIPYIFGVMEISSSDHTVATWPVAAEAGLKPSGPVSWQSSRDTLWSNFSCVRCSHALWSDELGVSVTIRSNLPGGDFLSIFVFYRNNPEFSLVFADYNIDFAFYSRIAKHLRFFSCLLLLMFTFSRHRPPGVLHISWNCHQRQLRQRLFVGLKSELHRLRNVPLHPV